MARDSDRAWARRAVQSRAVSPAAFERAVAVVLDGVDGWWAAPTARSRDRGVDVVVGVGDRRVGVQAKQYGPSRAVSAPEVRECAGSRDELGFDGFLVVTTGRFSEPARRAAAALDVGLLGSEDLLRWHDGAD